MLNLKRSPIRVTLIPAGDGETEVFVEFAPVTAAMRRRALRVWQLKMQAEGIEDLTAADPIFIGDLHELMSRELMRMGAIGWQGVADNHGKPLEMTPSQDVRLQTVADQDRPTGTLDLLLANEEAFAAIDQDYVQPQALRYAEKNASSGSPSGISAAATPGKDTASLPANRKAKRAVAKRARTAKTRSKPSKVKGSGRR